MKFQIFCLCLLSVLWCNNVTAYSSDDGGSGIECLQDYRKEKLEIDSTSTVTERSSRCRFIITSSLKLVTSAIENQIASSMADDAGCLINEFRYKRIADLIVMMSLIKKRELSKELSELRENKTETRMDKVEAAFDDELVQVAFKCDVDQKKFIEIFYKYLRTEVPRNVTHSAFVHNYCFAKYVVDNELFPLENIEINPYGIGSNVNCGAIIREEREREEQRLRTKYMRSTQTELECIEEEYRIRHIFDIHISLLVLRYFDLPRDIEDELTIKFKSHCWTAVRCGKYSYVNFCT